METTKYQQIMDRLEGRILTYQNAAEKAKGGPKLYTRTQVEGIRAKAMVEAKLIVWIYNDDEQEASRAYLEYRERAQAGQTTEDDAEIFGHGEDDESVDESPDGQEENSQDHPPQVG